MAEIIQYSWEFESHYQSVNHNPSPWDERCDIPKVGFYWRYFMMGEENTPKDERKTKLTSGKVTFWNKESGVVTTDADEILVRG